MANRAISVDHEGGESKLAGCMVWVFGLGFLTVGSIALYTLTIRPWYEYCQARWWVETPCVIASSKVGVHDDGDGATYSIDVTYNYQVAGRKYQGDAYSPFHRDFSSSGFASKKAVVDALPRGTKTVCFVDPDAPQESVLVRGLSWTILWSLFPLPFFAIGAGTTGALVYGKFRGPRDESATIDSEQTRSVLPDVSHDGPIQLEVSESPRSQFVGSLAIALFWNGVVSVVFFGPVWAGFAAGGDIPWGVSLCTLPFLGIGVWLIWNALRCAIALTNPRPLLTLSRGAIQRGGSATLNWTFDRNVSSIQRLKVCIIHEESATYTVGTDSKTDTETIYEDVLFDAQGMQSMASGQVEVEVPTNLMHSFESDNNKIEWAIEVHADIPMRPDLKARFPFRVI